MSGMLIAQSPGHPARAARLIVLDDELEIRNMLQRFLSGHGFDVRTVKDAAQLDHFLERQPYDLLILDIMMAGENGLSVCRRLRAEGKTIPILMLTARGDPVDKTIGLEMGADDYLAKPFMPNELVARVRAILRRQRFLAHDQAVRGEFLPEGEGNALLFGGFRLDLRRRELYRGTEPIKTNTAEMRLLCALAATPNRPVSRANLLERAHGPEYDANTRSVDVQVLRLRQIVEEDVTSPRHIRTVWGLGYMLIADWEA